MSRNRGYSWCLTVNNYTVPENGECPCSELIEKFKTTGVVKRAIVGKETGESGTPHLQAYVSFENQISFSTLKRDFPTAHIERARGSPNDNLDYCSKGGEYKTFGNFPPRRQVSTHRAILQAGLENDISYLVNDERYLRLSGKYDELFARIRSIKYCEGKFYELWNRQLFIWQLHVLRRLFTQSSRKVLWVHDSRGSTGKSFLCRYLRYVYGYQLFDGVSSVRDITASFRTECKGSVFDVTRDCSDKFSYNTLESVKNGYLFSGKYLGVYKEFDPHPVAVFANVPPAQEKLSADRWDIYNVPDSKDFSSPLCQTSFLERYPPIPPTPSFKISEEES